MSVMSSLKCHFGKACKDFMSKNPGRVITEADLAGLVGKAWHLALTLIAGFTKTGTYPLNPGRITDKQKAPSAVYCDEKEDSQSVSSQSLENLSVVSPDHSADPPKSPSSNSRSIDEILSLPKAQVPKKTSRAELTSTAQHVSESPFLQRLKDKKPAREEKSKSDSNPKSKPKSRSKSKSKSKPKSKFKPTVSPNPSRKSDLPRPTKDVLQQPV